MARFILASSSPRRIQLLKKVGLEFTVIPSSVEETFEKSAPPLAQVKRWAELKAHEVALKFRGMWVLGADTIVVVGDKVLGKPKDKNDARRMLGFLSGREHTVISAYSIMRVDIGRKLVESVETRVRVKRLSNDEIDGYIATGEPFDKAGAYGIQGIGSFLVKSIEGSYTNVVGLPLAEVLESLKELGVARPFEAKSGGV